MARRVIMRLRLAPALMASLLLAACAAGPLDPNRPKQTAGTVLGGVGGAVAGYYIGKAAGGQSEAAVGAVLGGLLGAAIGAEVGRQLDEMDRLKMEQAARTSLEEGRRIEWYNEETGRGGYVEPIRTGRDERGRLCREYRHVVEIDGRQEILTGTACRNPDGTWEPVGS